MEGKKPQDFIDTLVDLVKKEMEFTGLYAAHLYHLFEHEGQLKITDFTFAGPNVSMFMQNEETKKTLVRLSYHFVGEMKKIGLKLECAFVISDGWTSQQVMNKEDYNKPYKEINKKNYVLPSMADNRREAIMVFSCYKDRTDVACHIYNRVEGKGIVFTGEVTGDEYGHVGGIFTRLFPPNLK